jgi:hypothetical protein
VGPNCLTTANRLAKVQAMRGKGKFLTFYQYFLLALFHEGFAKEPRERTIDAELKTLLGTVPHLNGGLFDVHELEERNPKLDIPDEAFDRLFRFFDDWDWVLDTRPISSGKEINPEVLGYIFEKYINQKQMGAYYTKEDITEYISKSTIIPFLFDAAKKKHSAAFVPGSAVWQLLRDDPDRYLYPAVRHGVLDADGKIIPLPEAIAEGINNVSKRGTWNRPAPAPFGLPTETWREHVVRRLRCLDIREKLRKGEVHEINELITLNLNLRQFAEDVVSEAGDPDMLRAFWHAIREVTVLDPTCGSGAFLFAALSILQPLYETCLDRMQAFVGDLDQSGEHHSPKKFEDFRTVLADIEQHPNRDYFILKSIVIKNLYGVDIMAEAVEICKLRLFLKLVAQVEGTDQLEPLPDIDFNIRSGNTLVGFTSLDDVKRTLAGRLAFDKDEVERIVADAEIVDRAFRQFHEMQTQHGMQSRSFATAKHELRQNLRALAHQLDRYLAGENGIDVDKKPNEFSTWCSNHEPFHWFVEFYGTISRGGFNIVLGNPPYVEIPTALGRDALRRTYTTALERWSRDEDLYTLVVERSFQICEKSSGRFGMILPLSLAFSTKRPFQELRKHLSTMSGDWWWSHFDRIPSALFGNEVRTRCTIAMFGPSTANRSNRATTALIRWTSEQRESLFPTIRYATLDPTIKLTPGIPKVSSQLQADALSALLLRGKSLEADLNQTIAFSTLAESAPRFPLRCVFVGGTAYNWFPVWRDIPETTDASGRPSLPARTAAFQFGDEDTANAVFALLASALGYWWWAAGSDGFNLKKWLLERFPLSLSEIPPNGRLELAQLGAKLRHQLKSYYVYKDNKGRIGNYFLPACAELTACIDSAIARHVPHLSEDFFEDVRSFNDSFSRVAVQSADSEEEGK